MFLNVSLVSWKLVSWFTQQRSSWKPFFACHDSEARSHVRNALQAFQSVAQLRFWSMQNPFPHIFQLKGAVDAAKKTRIAILEPFWAGHFWCLTVMDLIPDDSLVLNRKKTYYTNLEVVLLQHFWDSNSGHFHCVRGYRCDTTLLEVSVKGSKGI